MQSRGLSIAYIVTAGNQAQRGLADIGQALLCDDRVSALGLHIEGLGSIAAFEALSKAAKAMGKGIVAIKVGKSEWTKTVINCNYDYITLTREYSTVVLICTS